LKIRRWCYNRDARKWIMSDSREFSSFLFLCEVCDLKPTPIRNFVLSKPEGWHFTDIVLGKLKPRSNKPKEVCDADQGPHSLLVKKPAENVSQWKFHPAIVI